MFIETSKSVLVFFARSSDLFINCNRYLVKGAAKFMHFYQLYNIMSGQRMVSCLSLDG